MMDFIVTSLALTTLLRTGTGTGDMQGARPMETPLFKNSSALASAFSSTPSFHTSTYLSSNSSSLVSGPGTQIINTTASLTSQVTGTAFSPFSRLAGFNTTRAPDLNNATECWPYSWSYSQASSDWDRSHQETYTYLSTASITITTGYPPLPTVTGNASLGDSSWTSYCDGLPRFTDARDASKLQIVTLATPIVTSRVVTRLSVGPVTERNPYPWRDAPSCMVNGTSECTNIWDMFATSLLSSLAAWSSSSILTISVPATPTAVVVNGQSMPLITAAPGQLPPLPILNSTYVPRDDHAGSAWYIDDAYNFIGETTIVPGQEVTFTWNVRETTRRPFGPTCDRPTHTLDPEQCSKTKECTIRAQSVELLFFPPPTSSRDLCANTSPGYNSYSQSIYSQPHQSAVVNGTTFWADKAYVRYNTVSAYKWCDLGNGLGRTEVPFGSTYTNAYVEVESRDVSTMCGWQITDRPLGLVIAATPVPMNFADLSGPVPNSAYQCLQGCDLQGGCKSIVQSLFNPNLAVPPQVRALDPEWADCVPYFEGTHDPPIALTAVPNFLTSTPVSMPAPGSTPTNGQPGPSSGRNTAEPTRPADSPFDPPFDGPSGSPTGSPSDPPDNPSNNKPTSTSPTGLPSKTPDNSPSSLPINSPFNPPSNPSNNEPPNNGPSNQPGGVTGAPTDSAPPSSTSPADPSGNTEVTLGSPSQDSADNNPANPSGSNPDGSSPSGSTSDGSSPGRNSGGIRPITNITAQPINIDPTKSVGSGAQATGISSDPDRGSLTVGAPTAINGIPVTAQLDGSVAITDPNGNQQIVRPGQDQISVNGHTVFLSPLGDKLVVDGQVYSISQQQSSTIRFADVPMIINPDGTVAIIVGGIRQTLQVGGPAISDNGHTVFLAPNGQMVVDRKTYTWNLTPDPSGNISVIGPDGSKTVIALSLTSNGPSGPLGDPESAAQATANSFSNDRTSEGNLEELKTRGSSGTNAVTPTGSSSGLGSTSSTSTTTGAASSLRIDGVWIVYGSVLATMAVMSIL